MNRILAVLVFLLLISSTQFSQQKENWQYLFNGNDLSGWELINGKAEIKVVNSEIVGTFEVSKVNTFLATQKNYSNFILEYEVKMDEGLNSGVQIRSHSLKEYRNGLVHGYQIELDGSSRKWSGGIYDEARRKWLYHLEYNPEAKNAYKPNEWNKFRIEAIDSNIRVWQNGIFCSDLIDDMDSEGFIALQVHAVKTKEEAGGKVYFRNIRIMTNNLKESRTSDNKPIKQISYLNNTLTEREKIEGWKLLWDGKSTNGWRGAKLNNFPENGWNIENGILSVQSSGGAESTNGGDIVTLDKFKNFELEVDFKYSKGANSGIKYLVDTELNKGVGSAIGCEYQIVDDDFHPDAKMGVNSNRTLSSVYDLITADAKLYVPDEKVSKRVNKYMWNRAKIVVNDKYVAHYLNGIKVVEYERQTQLWKALVAYSKYAKWKNFGELSEGNILLQEHGDEVSFRNIKIKEL